MRNISTDKLIIGLALMAIGVAAFIDAIDVFDFGNLWRYWPLAFIVIGLANEVEALRKRQESGGWMMIAFGVWMLAATRGVFGLTFRSAFPISIVIAGVFLVLHALIDKPAAKKEEKENVC